MTTYTCKCGRTFKKNTEAGTTGFRMPDYGPGHECYGCPFVCKVLTWDCITSLNVVKNHECRASKTLRYDTQAALSLGDKCVGRIYSLDLSFLHQVRDFADSLDGIDPDRYAFSDRPADYGDDGRYKLTIYPAQNTRGIAAKQTLLEMFFNSNGTRRDVTPDQEKGIVLNQIKEAKAMAQNTESPELTPVTKYTDGRFIYYVAPNNDGAFYVWYRDDNNPGNDPSIYHVILASRTFEDEQKALNTYARQNGNLKPCSNLDESPEMEQLSSPDDPAPESDFVPGPEDDLKMELVNDIPESGNDGNNSGDSDIEAVHSDNDSDNSENDDTEQPPQSCDWKNASGADDEEDNSEDDETSEVSGDPLSLRGPEFDAIISTADSVLNRLVAMLHEKKQRDGEMTVKVTFEDADGMGAYIFGGAVSGKINYTVKPQKISGEPLELKFDPSGNPVVPADREHQLNFDEIQAGQRDYPPSSGTAKVDGKTGIVEDYQEDGEEPEDPPTSDDVTNAVVGDDLDPSEESDVLYPCKNTDCPFYAYDPDGTDGCGYVPATDTDADASFDINEAVEQFGCTRPEVLQTYADAQPRDDTNLDPENESEDNTL